MYLENGTTVGFPISVIVSSSDGQTWTAIPKNNLRVNKVFIADAKNTGTRTYQYQNEARVFINHSDTNVLDFDIQELIDYSTGLHPYAGTEVDLKACLDKIIGWL